MRKIFRYQSDPEQVGYAVIVLEKDKESLAALTAAQKALMSQAFK